MAYKRFLCVFQMNVREGVACAASSAFPGRLFAFTHHAGIGVCSFMLHRLPSIALNEARMREGFT